MTPFDRHLRAVVGFLELGLPLEANEEIEAIEPEMKTLSEVHAVRVKVFRALSKWAMLEATAAVLHVGQPQISVAYRSRAPIIGRNAIRKPEK